jgi:hypothetical protein
MQIIMYAGQNNVYNVHLIATFENFQLWQLHCEILG